MIGSKVKLRAGTTAWSKAEEAMRDDYGVVYQFMATRNGDKYRVRFSDPQHHTLDVVVYGKDLKVLGEIDDLQEVKRLCISWGANPFGDWWDKYPYVGDD